MALLVDVHLLFPSAGSGDEAECFMQCLVQTRLGIGTVRLGIRIEVVSLGQVN